MQIDISNGELVDKVSILKIKLERISSASKRANIQKEFDLLYGKLAAIQINEQSDSFRRLLKINTRLWEIEDQIRDKESKCEFDADFIQLARQVYFQNDKRSQVKREINIQTESNIIEEKEYAPYR